MRPSSIRTSPSLMQQCSLTVRLRDLRPASGHVRRLPAVVERRVSALKKLQREYAQVEAQFYKDLYNLEQKYSAFYQPLFDKRSEIINATCEPTEGECQWEVGVQEAAWEEMEKEYESKGQTAGVPRFWLTAFKNAKILDRMIGENDELVLEHLKDVKIKFSGVEEPMSFTIEFVFKSNEYFFNEVLTKTYRIRSEPDDSDPFFSQGPKIISSTGCEIYWKEGKNVIVNSVKQQKCEGHGSVVPTSGDVPRRSFFTYFYPEGGVLDATTDYKLGYFFRKDLVPKSVLFFINEASEYMFKNFDEEAQEARVFTFKNILSDSVTKFRQAEGRIPHCKPGSFIII
uniref:Nucleosome assembly protein 1-like 4 n=1 Tax=Prolemur simus TaxID=1328070 RepID=A0A8C8ZP76_PROSS